MSMQLFRIRASACGKIMTNDRSGKNMGETAKSYCKDWLKEKLYGRRKEFQNKYVDKGLIMEDDSLDFVAEQLGIGMLIKNTQFYENEYMTGTPDAVINGLVLDVKNSWDCFTFPLFDTDIPNKDYWWQAQVYMELTGISDFKLCYVISDTPLHLIKKEAYWYAKNNGYGDVDDEMLQQFVDKMTYGDVPDNLKLKVFDIKKDDQAIESIRQRVILCREYIESLMKII